MEQFRIGNRLIGDGQPAYIIAEMSANHAGSLERAKEIIHAAKESGADCIKIQTYTPDTLTIDCNNHYFHIDNGTWEGENLYRLYGKAYTPWEWQKELKEEAEKVGLDFLSTPFDNTAVDFLEDMGLAFYKIASFEMVDLPLLSYVASKGKPIIMSTGMATLREMKEAVETIFATGNRQLALLKCYILHNIHLTALGPFAIGIVGGHHPNSGPSAYSIGQFGAHLYPAIFPFGKTLGGNAGRGNRGNRRAAGRIDRRLPLFGEQSVLYHRTVATNHDVQIAVLPIAVLGTGYRVIL